MSLALCPQLVSQAPQHLLKNSEKQATCGGCFARQSVCSVISLHAGMSGAVHSKCSCVFPSHLGSVCLGFFFFCGSTFGHCPKAGAGTKVTWPPQTDRFDQRQVMSGSLPADFLSSRFVVVVVVFIFFSLFPHTFKWYYWFFRSLINWFVQIFKLHSSGAVWESRWPSWAVRPNEPSGFRGRKDILNHASALVTTCP